MKPTLEQRLARAGHTLDAATDERAATEPTPSNGSAVSRASGRPLAAVAAVVALVIAGAAVLAVRSSDSGPGPASTAAEQVSEAVQATRGASAMTVDMYGTWSFAPDGVASTWNYGAPDRWEHLTQSEGPRRRRQPPGGVSVRLYVGDKTWGATDGWQAETPAHPSAPEPVQMLDELAATDCAVQEDGQLIAWSSGAGSCPNPDAGVSDSLPAGTWVWVLIVDDDGRLDEVRAADVLDLDALDGPGGLRAQEDHPDPMARLGALGDGLAHFWYENVPEVSVEPAE